MTRHVRPARPVDLSVLPGMLNAARAELHPGNAHHPAHCLSTLRGLMDDARGFVGVADRDGAVVGLVVGHAGAALWHPGIVAHCALRWVTPAERGRWGALLIGAFEGWAASIGAGLCGVSQTGRIADRAYRRWGYAPAEHMYFKEV